MHLIGYISIFLDYGVGLIELNGKDRTYGNILYISQDVCGVYIMRNYFFMSDAHFGHSDPDTEKNKEKKFVEFLEYVRENGSGLYIAGDLFDFWFEYKSCIPVFYFKILEELKKCVESGLDVRYITGNHDFWVFDFFPDYLGIPVYNEHLELNLFSKRIYVTHGDGLAKSDYGYRILKRIIQNRISIFLFKLVHPDLSYNIARFFSRMSRNHREIKNKDSEYIEFARKKFDEGYDYVVIGHTHRPMIYKRGTKSYVNTGDWYDKFTYAELGQENMYLEKWGKQQYKIQKEEIDETNNKEL